MPRLRTPGSTGPWQLRWHEYACTTRTGCETAVRNLHYPAGILPLRENQLHCAPLRERPAQINPEQSPLFWGQARAGQGRTVPVAGGRDQTMMQ